MTKRFSGPSEAEFLAGLFRRYAGIDVDPERLESRAAAVKSRKKVDDDAHIQRVKDCAIAAKKARRACEVAEMMWRMNPNADSLAAALAAQQVRNAADKDLRELLLHDEETIAAVQLRFGR